MEIIRNVEIEGSRERPVLLDIYFKKDGRAKPVVVFLHGFKGFKDWGHFDLMARKYAENGFVFIKYNSSYNGTTRENPGELSDFEAFGHNNLSTEANDLGLVIDYALQPGLPVPAEETEQSGVYLLGHSRGGGIVIVKAAEDPRVKKLATLASIHDFTAFWDEETMKKFKEDGVIYILNSRTGDELPIYYQMAEDYLANEARLNLPQAARRLVQPWLIVHGDEDETVPLQAARYLHQLNPASELMILPGADHSFGGSHPWAEQSLPEYAEKATEAIAHFFKRK